MQFYTISAIIIFVIVIFKRMVKMDIKKYRKILKMAQIDLAYEIGVSLTTVQLWERKVSKPNEENRNKIIAFFKSKEINIEE